MRERRNAWGNFLKRTGVLWAPLGGTPCMAGSCHFVSSVSLPWARSFRRSLARPRRLHHPFFSVRSSFFLWEPPTALSASQHTDSTRYVTPLPLAAHSSLNCDRVFVQAWMHDTRQHGRRFPRTRAMPVEVRPTTLYGRGRASSQNHHFQSRERRKHATAAVFAPPPGP